MPRSSWFGILLAGFWLLCALPPLEASTPPFEARQVRRVVMLYSGPLDFPATEMTERGIREVFFSSSSFHVQLYSEYLDLSRFRDTRQKEALADLLRQRYGDGGPDLIIGVDVPAAVFLMETAETVFPGVPIVLCSIPEALRERIEASPIRVRTSGVQEPSNARELVAAALSFRPSTKHAALIAGSFENDQIRAVALRKALQDVGDRIQLLDLTGLSMEVLLERCRELPRDTVIFFATFFVDGTGRSFVPRDVLKTISETSGAPVFGLYESYLGHGIVGGRLVSLKLQGKRAAEIGLGILSGVPPGAAPFDAGEDTSVTAYDWRQLKRWKISEHELPLGSRVMYREATAWDLYKFYIIGAFSLVVLESLLIIALVVNLQRRKRAEIALRESRQDLRNLAGRLISSQEEELRRLSREFHDDLAQRLAVVAIESGTLELQAKDMEPHVLEKISRIKDQLIGLSEDVHAISRQIHPAILRDLGLVRAVESLCVSFSDREGIAVDLDSQNLPENIAEETALCVYRVIQESLRNIARHSQAAHVAISLRGNSHRISLKIRDDGIGFVPQDARHTPGIGLASMRERVEYVNGDFKIHSEPGMGASIEVTVPAEGGCHETGNGPAR